MLIAISCAGEPAKRYEVDDGQTVLEALQQAGVCLVAPCGGAGTCGRCGVLVRSADQTRFCLACQTPLQEGMELLLEDDDMLIAGTEQSADSRTGAPQPANEGKDWGLAVDIGTTTLVAYLVDLSTGNAVASHGVVNPQATFGSDVISRIQAARSPESFETLCSLLATAIDDARRALARKAGISESLIGPYAVVGNTVMQHFACHLDPEGIGVSPFTPLSYFGEVRALGAAAGVAPHEAYLAPAVAGYVGGDITAGLLCSGMRERDELQLFVDIGTNGEMALGNREGILCCATAAGPAFEGAGITFGMPARAGAVDRVRWDGESLIVGTVRDAAPVGICGSGLIDALACLLEAGLVDETGRLEACGPASGLVGAEAGETVVYLDPDRRVYLTQGDIRRVQLAKAAIRAGIETMLDARSASVDSLGELALAGGFGMSLDPRSAARIGLFPPQLVDRVSSLGNAAGKGAVAALSPQGKQELAEIAASCTYLELSTSAAFNGFYIDAMMFEEDD